MAEYIISKLAIFFPDFGMILILGPIFLVWSIIIAMGVGCLRIEKGLGTPYTRKIFHFVIFTSAALIHLLLGLTGAALFGGIVTSLVLYAVLRGDGFPFYEALARPSDSPFRSRFILIPLFATALGGITVNLLFPVYAYIGYLVAAWGDAVGEPVGTRWGKHRYAVPSLFGQRVTRSWEGSTAVFVASALAAMAGLWIHSIGIGNAVIIGMICAGICTLIEAISHHGMDNFTVQVGAAGTIFFLARVFL